MVAERAGYRCSLPICGRLTVGPGARQTEVARSGTASHIYSAASRGPRGQGGLAPEELESPSNAIWLCGDHGRIVDNNRGDKYPPELLLFYKQLHEARIANEHEGLYTPLGWLFDLAIKRSPLFKPESRVSFSKLTLLMGGNGSGKTAICEWIRSPFDVLTLNRWRSPCTPLNVQLRYCLPQEVTIGLQLSAGNTLSHWINGSEYAFNPLRFRVIAPVQEPRRRFGDEEGKSDDLAHLCHVFGLDSEAVRVLASKISAFPHTHARNLRFESEDGSIYLHLDLDGTHPGLSFGALSGREQETVLLEFATAIARESSSFTPTLLVLDSFTSIFFDGWFDYFSHHFLDPANQFQTLMTIPTIIGLDVARINWNGWEVVQLSGRPPRVEIGE